MDLLLAIKNTVVENNKLKYYQKPVNKKNYKKQKIIVENIYTVIQI